MKGQMVPGKVLPVQWTLAREREGKVRIRVWGELGYRGEEDGVETAGRTRRPKSELMSSPFNKYVLANFSEDFVYDDIVMRNSIT